MFAGLEQQNFNPASIISNFEEEEEQRAVAELFNTKLAELTTDQEREKAFHDILISVKTYSYECDCERMGNDMDALKRAIAGKKALEELKNTHISLD